MAKRKKKISKTEKKLRNKVKYLRSKNRKIVKEFEKLSGKDENKFIKYEGKRKLVRTVKNILRNKITKNNTSYNKVIERLEKQFKYFYRKRKPKQTNRTKGVTQSPDFNPWEYRDVLKWIDTKNIKGVLNEIKMPLLMEINAVISLMSSDNTFYIAIDYNDLEFSVNMN